MFSLFSGNEIIQIWEWIKNISDILTNFADMRRLLLLFPPTLGGTHTQH